MTQLEGFVEKGWGSEFIWATNDKYCGKLLNFNKDARFSMHFHAVKDETWLVLSGKFDVLYIDTKDATVQKRTLKKMDTMRLEPLTPHQVICIEQGLPYSYPKQG